MNPFIWCSIDLNNFCRLIENYDSLNFNNIECVVETNVSGICFQKSLCPKIIIDGKVEVNYFHYIEDKKYNSPTKVKGYTAINDVKKYAIDCYTRRLEKMNGEPIFIWDVTRAKWYNKQNENPIYKIRNINSNYTVIIYSSKVKTDLTSVPILLNKTNDDFEVNQSAANIYKMYLNKL
jgi:hypothetical protein